MCFSCFFGDRWDKYHFLSLSIFRCCSLQGMWNHNLQGSPGSWSDHCGRYGLTPWWDLHTEDYSWESSRQGWSSKTWWQNPQDQQLFDGGCGQGRGSACSPTFFLLCTHHNSERPKLRPYHASLQGRRYSFNLVINDKCYPVHKQHTVLTLVSCHYMHISHIVTVCCTFTSKCWSASCIYINFATEI